jgi:hypothetical protein
MTNVLIMLGATAAYLAITIPLAIRLINWLDERDK